jgi:hypothetical protein
VRRQHTTILADRRGGATVFGSLLEASLPFWQAKEGNMADNEVRSEGEP